MSARHTVAFQIGFVLLCSAGAQALDWTKPSLATLPSARTNSSAAYDSATHATVLFGGNTGNVVSGDTWIFTRALGWSQLSPANSPSARSGAGFAYDPITKTAVLFGGNGENNTLLGDTWTWDGTTWTQQFPPVSPPARGFNTEQMAFDSASSMVVLFGGFARDGAYFGDTWVWDGHANIWIQRFPPTSPSPRVTTIAYDGASKQVTLFGGSSGGAFLGDTWTWDGVTWTQQSPESSPSARVNHVMAYDASIGKIVLFGGYNYVGGQALNDTWIWNGTVWTQIQTSFTPAGRYGSSMDYDPNFKGLLLFGGYFTDGPNTNQTWIFR